MKFLGLVEPKDEKAIYRKTAEETIHGSALAEVQHGQVELFEPARELEDGGTTQILTKEEIAKLANKLRNGLREFGRFNVKVEGNIAEISVSNRATRTPKKKADKAVDAPKAPAKKAAK